MEKLKERRLTDADKKLKLASHYKIESECTSSSLLLFDCLTHI